MTTTKITLISQIINKLDKNIFLNLVNKSKSDSHHKKLNSWTHLVSMIFLHISQSNSLRDISNGLRSATGNNNHLGIKHVPSKSSLSYLNKHRDNQLFKDFYDQMLLKLSKQAQFKQQRFRFKSKIFLVDSTTISLCTKLYDWANYRQKKGGIKLHTILDYDSCLPNFTVVSQASMHDSKIMEFIKLSKGSVAVFDRAYLNFKQLYELNTQKVFFVTRLKSNTQYISLHEKPLPEIKAQQILKDEIIELSKDQSKNAYPLKLRRVVVFVADKNQTIELVTNNFYWTAETISELYKCRWQIEVFFKEIKTHLKIKTFVGTSENAVKIQIWTALITIMLIKYLKNIAKYKWCLSNLVAFIKLNTFVKFDLNLLLNYPFKVDDKRCKIDSQYSLFSG